MFHSFFLHEPLIFKSLLKMLDGFYIRIRTNHRTIPQTTSLEIKSTIFGDSDCRTIEVIVILNDIDSVSTWQHLLCEDILAINKVLTQVLSAHTTVSDWVIGLVG